MIKETELGQFTTGETPERLQYSAGPWAKPNPLYVSLLFLIALILPWLTMQIDGGRFILHLFIIFFAWGMVTQCWNLIMGVSGIYSFA